MTNFYYGGERKQENIYVSYGNGEKPCDECGDIYDRFELSYIIPEFTYNNNNNEDLEKTAWTVKLCGPCLTSTIHEHDEHNENRILKRK